MSIRAIAFGGFLIALSVRAQPPGTFTATGDMSTWRVFHTATLLTDGRVLIAGGCCDNNQALSSAELYDPSTGTFTPTGSMTTQRSDHTATLLPDGKVLIAGGIAGVVMGPAFSRSVLASAELYDPSSGTFAAAGNMTKARARQTATLLSDGKVLLAGGSNVMGGGIIDAGSIDKSAELYDPSTGGFASTGNMTVARENHKATLLANGAVLIVPSTEGDGPAELYDPARGTFRPTGWIGSLIPELESSVAYAENLLTNGKVMIAIATPECDFPEAHAQIYDPATETFSATGNLVKPRCAQNGTSLSDGAVLITGTYCYPDSVASSAASAEVYDPASGTFAQTGDMITGRSFHSATLLKDGRVLMAGGFCWNSHPITAELYNPRSVASPPTLLSPSGDGQGAGAILHAATQQVVLPSNPALVGETLEIFATGLIDAAVIPPQVAIGGLAAEVLFFGAAPGYPGLNQINVRVPSGVAPGPAVLVRLNYLSRPSNAVTIDVR